MKFEVIQDNIWDHFTSKRSLERVRVMAHYAFQTEGWWKVEMMSIIKDLKNAKPEYMIRDLIDDKTRRRIDFYFELNDSKFCIESKALCRHYPDESPCWLSEYIGTPKNPILLDDFQKLANIKLSDSNNFRCYLLLFVYPTNDIEKELPKFITKFKNKIAAQPIGKQMTFYQREFSNDKLSIIWLEVNPI